MKTNHVLAGVALLGAAGAVWLAASLMGGGDHDAVERSLAPAPAPRPESRGELQRRAEGESRESVAAPEALAVPAAAADASPWEGELGGLVGRVVEEEGTPVAGISVALVQVDASLLLAGDWTALGEPEPKLVLDRTLTDAEGRFRLGGAYDASFQGLGIDLRGPRSTVRVVDAQLHHGEVTDVGDIVLRGGCTITGKVVDEAGLPVAGARVRIAPTPPDQDLTALLQVGIQDFRADSAVGVSRMIHTGADRPVIEPPPIVRQHIDDLPIPTTFTDPDGKYRIEGAPVGRLLQGVDKPGLVGVSRLVETTPGEVALEDAVLTAGVTVEGIVVDYDGDPVAGVEVLAGTELVFGEAAILHPAGVTGADGRFSVPGCPPNRQAMACARRSPDEPWVGVLEPVGSELEIELENTVALTVRVVDETGKPVRGATVELAPGGEERSPMGIMGRFMSLGAPPREARLVETDEGIYVADAVTPGLYEVTARPPGLAMARESIEVWSGKTELKIVCERGQGIDLTVIDAATGAGVRSARASVIGAGFPLIEALAVGRTDGEGRARLGPFPLRDPDGGSMFGRMPGGRRILVQHPGYADASVQLEDGAVSAQVPLVRGGEIHGVIRWGEDPPLSIYMLVLQGTGERDELLQAFLPPRLGRSDLSGAFRFSNLPPGTYRLSVFDRFLDEDPILLMMGQKEPTMVHREDGVELEPAGRTDVVIDLSPSGRGQTARIAGTVRLDYRGVAGATVRVNGRGASVSTETDELGRFETPDFLALGEVRVQVTGDVEAGGSTLENFPIHSESITPTPQSVYRMDLDLLSRPLRVIVKGPGGDPVAGARVELVNRGRGRNPRAQTDAGGVAALTLVGESEREVKVTADGFAAASVDVDPTSPEFDGEVAIELKGAVPCAGVCDLTAFDPGPSAQRAFLRVDDRWEMLEEEDVRDDGRAAFRFEGLQPGTYEARIWFDGRQAAPLTFDLPPGGSENLYLAFQPAEGR